MRRGEDAREELGYNKSLKRDSQKKKKRKYISGDTRHKIFNDVCCAGRKESDHGDKRLAGTGTFAL